MRFGDLIPMFAERCQRSAARLKLSTEKRYAFDFAATIVAIAATMADKGACLNSVPCE
jgi:hypothetical protein